MQIHQFPYDSARKYPRTAAVPPEVAAFLKGASCQATTVKDRAKRSVFSVYAKQEPSRPAYFVKFDHPLRWLDKAKGPVRPKVKKEYQITRRLFDLQVPVIEPVFCSWTPFLGVFVSRALPGAVGFGTQWRRVKDDPVLRQAFLKQWRWLLITVLQNNLYHSDFHSGNILTVKNGNDFTFFLVDVVDIKICRRLSERQILQNLRTLADFCRELKREEKIFLVSGLPGKLQNFSAEAIWRKIQEHTVRVFYQKGWRHLRERVYKKESLVHFIDDDPNHRYWIGKGALSLSTAKAVIAAYKTGCRENIRQMTARKSGRAAVRMENKGAVYLVQEYGKQRRPLFRSAAMKTWFTSWAMFTAGFAVPRPLVLAREKRGSGFIVFAPVEGQKLPELLGREGELTHGNREILFQALYDSMCRLYAWRIVHNRLQLAHFVVTAENRLILLPSDGWGVNRRITRRRWQKDKRRLLQNMPPPAAEAFRQWLKTRDNPVDL